MFSFFTGFIYVTTMLQAPDHDGSHHSTPNHCHKQLLIRWEREMMITRRDKMRRRDMTHDT